MSEVFVVRMALNGKRGAKRPPPVRFRLVQVEIGRNAKGEPVFAEIPEYVDARGKPIRD